jgi:hypothetical protein
MRDSAQGLVLQLVEAFLSRSATYKPTRPRILWSISAGPAQLVMTGYGTFSSDRRSRLFLSHTQRAFQCHGTECVAETASQQKTESTRVVGHSRNQEASTPVEARIPAQSRLPDHPPQWDFRVFTNVETNDRDHGPIRAPLLKSPSPPVAPHSPRRPPQPSTHVPPFPRSVTLSTKCHPFH